MDRKSDEWKSHVKSVMRIASAWGGSIPSDVLDQMNTVLLDDETAVPKGFVLVPIQPSPEKLKDVAREIDRMECSHFRNIQNVYTVAIAPQKKAA